MGDQLEWDARIINPSKYFLRVQSHTRKLVQMLPEIENTMDWYDHVAFIFLAYSEPLLALQKIQAIVRNHQQGLPWRNMAVSPFVNGFTNSSEKALEEADQLVIEIFCVLQQFKLLNCLGVEAKPVCSTCIDPLRLKLFCLIEDFSKDQTERFVRAMNLRLGKNYTQMQPCVEMHLLEWIIDKHITGEDDSKLVNSLNDMGLGVGTIFARSARPAGTYPTPNPLSLTSPSSGLMTFKVTSGLCIIINQMVYKGEPGGQQQIVRTFSSSTGEKVEYRFGSDVDRDNLAEVFRMLGHNVEIYENLSHKQLLDTFQAVSKYDFERYDALTVCVLSHGERESIMSCDWVPVKLDVIKAFFNGVHCPVLVDKPKMFFLQACQGVANQQSVSYVEEYQPDGVMHSSPAVSNFFEAWATVPGFVSYRSVEKGAVFVRGLSETLWEYGHRHSLLDLMTMVNNNVARWRTPDHKRQMSQISSCLSGRVEFRRDRKKLIEAALNLYENRLFSAAVKPAAGKLFKEDKHAYAKLIRQWGSS